MIKLINEIVFQTDQNHFHGKNIELIIRLSELSKRQIGLLENTEIFYFPIKSTK